jgi:hypothetical protein
MPDDGTPIDPRELADLLAVEQGSGLLGQAGVRAEFWEIHALLKSDREALLAEFDRLLGFRRDGVPAQVDPRVAERLKGVRAEMGPTARELRGVLARAAPELDSLRADLALILLMGSVEDRAAAARWIEAPEASFEESRARLRLLGVLVDAYRSALLDARRSAPAAEVLPPVGGRPSSVSPTLRPQLVKDLVLMSRGRTLLESLEPGLGWELGCLVLQDAAALRPLFDELEQLKAHGRPGEFAGAAYNLRQRLREVRDQAGELCRVLRGYLGRADGGAEEELALAMLMSTEEGRERARQWLQDPEPSRGEATAAMNGFRSRARLHLEALARERG